MFWVSGVPVVQATVLLTRVDHSAWADFRLGHAYSPLQVLCQWNGMANSWRKASLVEATDIPPSSMKVCTALYDQIRSSREIFLLFQGLFGPISSAGC